MKTCCHILNVVSHENRFKGRLVRRDYFDPVRIRKHVKICLILIALYPEGNMVVFPFKCIDQHLIAWVYLRSCGQSKNYVVRFFCRDLCAKIRCQRPHGHATGVDCLQAKHIFYITLASLIPNTVIIRMAEYLAVKMRCVSIGMFSGTCAHTDADRVCQRLAVEDIHIPLRIMRSHIFRQNIAAADKFIVAGRIVLNGKRVSPDSIAMKSRHLCWNFLDKRLSENFCHL